MAQFFGVLVARWMIFLCNFFFYHQDGPATLDEGSPKETHPPSKKSPSSSPKVEKVSVH